MRIHRVEIEGFGPFRTRQVVDLDTYSGDGIFLIAGRTGAGKSSILDAICFALYGTAPRYEDGGDKRLRSDHAEPEDRTQVALEFTNGDRTWRIERSPEFFRPKKRGEGVTPQKAEARMFERIDGEWVGRAARPVDVANLVEEEIGLTQQQFLQVILLAQGRFARFLLADVTDRQKLLRTLFGTKRFEEYEKALDERRKEALARVEHESQALIARLDHAAGIAGDILAPLDGDPSLPDRIGWIGRAALRARHLAEEADAAQQQAARALAEAEAVHAERTSQREKQQRRDAARSTLASLEADAAGIAELRTERDAAHRAEPVRAAQDAARRALATLHTANDTLEAAGRAWVGAGEDDLDATALDALVAEAQQRIGAWRPLRDTEVRLEADARAIEALRSQAAEATRRLETLDARARALPDERARIQDAISRADVAMATRDALAAQVAALEAQLAVARSIDALLAAQKDAFADLQRAKNRKDEAETHHADLQARRFAGMAGELAAELIDGEACAVCGSTSHPAPAERGDDPVSADDVEQADRARRAAVAAYESANTAYVAADRAHADALKDSGGRSAEVLATELDAARAELAAARKAAAEKERLGAERAALDAEAQRHDAERAAAIAERSDLEARATAAAATLKKDRAAVADARGEAVSVAARIDAEQRLVTLATGYAEAQREAARAEKTAVEAGDALQAAAQEAGFADPADAIAALRDASQRASLEARIREHETALGATRSTLLELELEMLPEELVDTAESGAAVDAARAAWVDAVKHHTTAAERALTLEGATMRIEAAHAEIADLAREAAEIKRLADTVAGRANNSKRMKLETFVLAAELEEIVAAANIRLAEMSADRYRLQHSDALAARGAASGLGLEVMDQFTGRARSAQSLSGGETFLASLALALGLAEVVTGRAGGIRLDTLFIDEGFGSLDAETLDTAMRTLDELRQGGRTVGVISHVEAMKEQIPAQLRVEQTPQGWSVVKQDHAVALVS
ncbi:AAA family ATPase [Microbacterium sp. JZ31]|uniref:AAA family ATPase n=1 Tax=Microbacterium sp. JZ31 TaxID=1906274 RepID=UPI0019345290|nr:SMC family ATPase [Microbacterium sp. JZ31]